MAGKAYPEAIKAKVRAQLEAGASAADVAQAEALPAELVTRWAIKWGLLLPPEPKAPQEPAEPRPGPSELSAYEVQEARGMLHQGLSVQAVVRQLQDRRRVRRALGWGEHPECIWRP